MGCCISQDDSDEPSPLPTRSESRDPRTQLSYLRDDRYSNRSSAAGGQRRVSFQDPPNQPVHIYDPPIGSYQSRTSNHVHSRHQRQSDDSSERPERHGRSQGQVKAQGQVETQGQVKGYSKSSSSLQPMTSKRRTPDRGGRESISSRRTTPDRNVHRSNNLI